MLASLPFVLASFVFVDCSGLVIVGAFPCVVFSHVFVDCCLNAIDCLCWLLFVVVCVVRCCCLFVLSMFVGLCFV